MEYQDNQEKNHHLQKKSNESEKDFFKRFEGWLYQNNPYFIYQQKQLENKDKKDKTIGDLRAIITQLRQAPPVQVPQFRQDKSFC